MNVFLDTNVIIDFMGEREGFFEDAAAIFAMIEDKRGFSSFDILVMTPAEFVQKAKE